MASPICTVKDGSDAAQPTTTGYATVTPSNTVTIAIADVTGVGVWSIICIATDETTDAATITASLTINNVNKTATLTAPAAGKAMIFRSQVNGGRDSNGVNAALTTTFKVATLTASSLVVSALNEEFEHSSTFGWLPVTNGMVRAAGIGPIGLPAYAVTTVDFVQPSVSSNVLITAGDTLDWMAVGEPTFIEGAGFYTVISRTSATQWTVRLDNNTGYFNEGVTVDAGAKVTSSGVVGATGATGPSGAIALYDAFLVGPTTGNPPLFSTLFVMNPTEGYVVTGAVLSVKTPLTGGGSTTVRMGTLRGAPDDLITDHIFTSASTYADVPVGLNSADLGTLFVAAQNYEAYTYGPFPLGNGFTLTRTTTGTVSSALELRVQVFGYRAV